MKCKKVMTQLPAYLDRELDEAEARELERHLEVCVYCSTELAALRATSRMLDTWESVSPRRCFVGGVINQIKAEERGAAKREGRWLRLLKARWMPQTLRAAAATIFVVGAAVFSFYSPVKQAPEQVVSEEVAEPHGLAHLIPFEEDSRRSFIRPSEWELFRQALDNRGGIVQDVFWPKDAVALPVNHIYLTEEGMPVESVIPIGDSRRQVKW